MTDSLLSPEWVEKLSEYKKCYVGFSGGLDSTVLLHCLATLPHVVDKLIAVHVNHGLQPAAEEWQAHCQQICGHLNIPIICHSLSLSVFSNIEEQARDARYQFFSSLMAPDACMLVAHHEQDQAETLLLQLCRGAGVDGLASMVSEKRLGAGMLLRPFLHLSRSLLENEAYTHQLIWVEDVSNANTSFSRNFIRHEILPLLEKKWPAVIKNISRSAQHCQEARDQLEALALLDCPQLVSCGRQLNFAKLVGSVDNGALTTVPTKINPSESRQGEAIFQCSHSFPAAPVDPADGPRDGGFLPASRIRNMLRVWLRYNQVTLPSKMILNRIVNEVMNAPEDANPLVAWGEYQVTRYRKVLYLSHSARLLRSVDNCAVSRFTPTFRGMSAESMDPTDTPRGVGIELTYQQPLLENHSVLWANFPEPLLLEQCILKAIPHAKGLSVPEGAQIEIRFRQAGQRFSWHGQTKKLKKLFQQWGIPPWERDRIPLLYINGELAAVVGYAVSDLFYRTPGEGTQYRIDTQQSVQID